MKLSSQINRENITHENALHSYAGNGCGFWTWCSCCPRPSCSGQGARLLRRGNRRHQPGPLSQGVLPQGSGHHQGRGVRIVSVGGTAGGAKVTALDGEAPKRAVVQVWDSMEKIQAWRSNPEYKELRKVGDKYAKFRSYTVEGLPQ